MTIKRTNLQDSFINYLRKERNKAVVLSLDEPVNEGNDTLKDILPDNEELLDAATDRNMTIEYIKKNGFTRREKDVFFLLFDGCTVREAAGIMGISHVMVVKIKKSFVRKLLKKKKYRLPKAAIIYLYI